MLTLDVTMNCLLKLVDPQVLHHPRAFPKVLMIIQPSSTVVHSHLLGLCMGMGLGVLSLRYQ